MSNKQIPLPLPLGGTGLGLSNTEVEGSEALTRGLSIRVSSLGLWCRDLYSGNFRGLRACGCLPIGLLNFMLRRPILGVIAILLCTAKNKCLKHMYLTTQKTFADTIPVNDIGCIELL